VRRVEAVVCISETAKKELLGYVKIDEDRVTVIPNCVSGEFKHLPKVFNEVRPRILQVGTSKNKNISRVLEALAGISCVLVIIGRLDDQLREQVRRAGVEVECKSDLSREELIVEYQHADIVMFASTYEGFGLPILEGNAVGRVVITSKISSMPEVAGDAACLVDPFSVGSIRRGLLRVIEDAPYRSALIQRGLTNATKFSANAIAARYAALYRSVAEKASDRRRYTGSHRGPEF
jgi:glycosyltransferase involved in cell wall biosynthesis